MASKMNWSITTIIISVIFSDIFLSVLAANEECGTKRVGIESPTIAGQSGHVALKNEFPWTVAIYDKTNRHLCGGTLISERHVLSGAVCFADSSGIPRPKDDYTIVAGKHYRDYSTADLGSQIRKVKSMHVHENFRGRLQSYRDDIAIVELSEKITVSLEAQPVCVDWENALEDVDFTDGKLGEFAGWGYTKPLGSPSEVLKKIVLPFKSSAECKTSLPAEFAQKYFTNDKFCAGYINQSIGVCSGDSGGGLYFKSDGMHYFIRGILSLSLRTPIGCDMDNVALYTRVSNYLSWIKNIIETS